MFMDVMHAEEGVRCLELEFRWLWELGIELLFYEKAASALNC